MEHDLVLEGRAVTPAGIVQAEVGVEDGKIAELKKSGLRGSRRLRVGDCLIFPGFIDSHVHLREPGQEWKEDFRSGTLAAAHGGVTTVADMPNNLVPATNPRTLKEKRRLADSKGVVSVELYAGVDPADIGGVERSARESRAFKVYLSKTTGAGKFPHELLREALVAVAATGKRASLHCEDQEVIDRAVLSLRGVKRNDRHCDERPPEAEVLAVSSSILAARGVKGAEINVCHASTGETVRLVERAAAEGVRAACEAALHHLYFNRKAMLADPRLGTNPPLRVEGDRRSLLEGLRDGSVSYLVTDHAPHLLEEKEAEDPPSGVPGLDDYTHVAAWLIRSQGFEPSRVAEVASSAPATHLGLHDRGTIEVGKRADFTVVDLHSPEKVRAEELKTKCGWSPYEGKEFPGRARWTIVAGRPVVDDFEVLD